MGLEFHKYIKDLRARYTSNTRKLCLILKVPHTAWSKIERGIKPPPSKPKILKLFSRVVQTKSYEEVELFALANRPHELLIPPAEAIPILGEREYNRRMEASYEANKPDYEHKHFKPMLPVGTTSKESAKVEQEEETQTIIHAS